MPTHHEEKKHNKPYGCNYVKLFATGNYQQQAPTCIPAPDFNQRSTMDKMLQQKFGTFVPDKSVENYTYTGCGGNRTMFGWKQ